MRTSAVDKGRRSVDVMRGNVDAAAARSFSWVEEMTNDTGSDILEGSVVVVLSDGTIALADTENDPRPTGVVVDQIDDGDTGQVVFGGPVDMVLTTGSVTAGTYGQTSTTPGEAQTAGSPAKAFCEFTDTGTDPPAFLWGGRGGGGTIAGVVIEDFDTSETDTALVLHPDGTGGSEWGVDATGGSEPAFDHGSMGATETIDLADGRDHRGTLDADCTITLTGFTVDQFDLIIFECTQDGTGGWAITWDPDVVFVGDDQPDQTASATTVFLLFSSAGDSLIYGAKVGAGSTVAALDDLTDVTITSATANDDLRFDGSVWVNDARKWEAVTDGEDVFVWEGDDLVHEWESY